MDEVFLIVLDFFVFRVDDTVVFLGVSFLGAVFFDLIVLDFLGLLKRDFPEEEDLLEEEEKEDLREEDENEEPPRLAKVSEDIPATIRKYKTK